MSRFQGAAGKGASRTLRAVRRAEAETRQAAERARDEAWRAAHCEPGPLSHDALEELVDVLNGLSVAELLWLFEGMVR